MSVAALVDRLRASGVTITAEGDRLKVTAPRGAITPDLREAITEHKAALLWIVGTPKQLPFGVMSDTPSEAAEGTTPSGDQSVAGFILVKGEHATLSNDEIAQALIAACPAIAVTFDTGTIAADRLRVWQALIDQPVAQLAAELNQARSALDVLIEQQSDDPTWAATWDRACSRYHAARVAFESIPIA